MQELWAEIRSGETTALDFDPPRCGWLEIDLDAIGQPGPSPSSSGSQPPLHSLGIMGVAFHQGQANLVMHDQERGISRALSFQHYGGGSFYYEDAQMIPGETKKPIEVFLPGKYELEVRVPGFPVQSKEVMIEEESFTAVRIILQGEE